ncbi:hypothetical protein B5X24_HaOG200116 [Helicoverpa armigera]|uniref:Carboxylic ester hydrolase n=1 Tax=Helicoverpa armigera TaxID=29058 RepID=A0A2W1BTR6_HELAM|nr:hypothetical protein B5X24_HaOG200116 [Helicoverpa armigera]
MSQCLDMLSILTLVLLCGFAHGLFRVDPLVNTKGGLIRGLRSENGYAMFLGIPYAVVNKDNPFGPSAPHQGFDDVFDAYESNICPQLRNGVPAGTLDCLTLNVYVPSAATTKTPFPVMVWIHGGGFIGGSSSRDSGPDFLLRNDVIVVAINYRVGAYGFMCLDMPEVSGNQGLKDQVLGLRWIKENIEAFGGDANQITVFGESAGGMSINLHLLSNYESLFHRAIIQSGPAVSPWVSRDVNNTIPLSLAEALEYNAESVADAIDYLSTIDPHTLVKTAAELKLTETDEADNPLTLPCIETYTEGVEHFMTQHPKNIKSDKVAKTPIIIGHNNNEMPFEYALQKDEFFDNYDFTYLLNQEFEFGEDLEDALKDIRHFYIGDEKASVYLKDLITDFASDFVFNHPTQRMAERFLELGAKTVYRYIFSYSGGRNLLKWAYNLDVQGAVHADELGYLFDMVMLKGDITPEDQLMIDRLTTLWTNFAKYGNPTPETSDLLPEKWLPITKTTQPFLDMDAHVTMGARPFREAMAFWDVFYKLHRKQHKYYQDPEE